MATKPRTRAAEAATAETVKSTAVVQMQPPTTGLLPRMAARYHLAPEIFERTVYAMAMPKDASREEFIGCLMIAHEHDLNPLVKEIYFMRTKEGKIQPIVSVDGWVTKAQRHPQFKGFTFKDLRDDKHNVIAIECSLHRHDLPAPVTITEYMSECRGGGTAWGKTPNRMLRHRALTQAVRYGVGFAGVMDRDEFEQWQGTDRQFAAAPSLPMPTGPLIEAEASQASPDDATEQEGPDADTLLAELKIALGKVNTIKELEATWGRFETQVERTLPLDRQPEAFKLYDAAESRVSAGMAT